MVLKTWRFCFLPLLPPVYFLFAKFILKKWGNTPLENTVILLCEHILVYGCPSLKLNTTGCAWRKKRRIWCQELAWVVTVVLPRGRAVPQATFCFRQRQAGCRLCYLRTLDKCGSLWCNLILEGLTQFTFLVRGFPTFLDSGFHFNNFFKSREGENIIPLSEKI